MSGFFAAIMLTLLVAVLMVGVAKMFQAFGETFTGFQPNSPKNRHWRTEYKRWYNDREYEDRQAADK